MWAPASPGHQGSISGLVSVSCLTLALPLTEPQFPSLENRNKALCPPGLTKFKKSTQEAILSICVFLLSGMNVNKNNTKVVNSGPEELHSSPLLFLVGGGDTPMALGRDVRVELAPSRFINLL